MSPRRNLVKTVRRLRLWRTLQAQFGPQQFSRNSFKGSQHLGLGEPLLPKIACFFSSYGLRGPIRPHYNFQHGQQVLKTKFQACWYRYSCHISSLLEEEEYPQKSHIPKLRTVGEYVDRSKPNRDIRRGAVIEFRRRFFRRCRPISQIVQRKCSCLHR